MKIITLLSGVLGTNVLSMPCYTQICSLASAVGNGKFLLMAQFHTETKFCVLHIILIVGLNIWAFFWGSAHPPCTLEGLYGFGTSLTILSRPPEPPLSPSSAGLPRPPLPRSARAALPPSWSKQLPPWPLTPLLLSDLNFSHKLHAYYSLGVYMLLHCTGFPGTHIWHISLCI